MDEAWRDVLDAFPGGLLDEEPAGPDALADALGRAARRLAPGDDAPADGAEAAAWAALVHALDRLYGSGVAPLGRLPFVGDRLLELLREEARAQLAEGEPGRRAVGEPGRVLASLAVSRKLRDAVSAALGLEVMPTYEAVYEHDPPGSHVRTHVDARGYEVVVHLIVEQTPAGRRSELVAHLPGGTERLALGVGEAVALRGRGTIHSWAPLAGDERRTLVAIGFESGPRAPG